MTLNEQQKTAVTSWANEGCSLSEIQRRLAQQFNLTMTYIDVRLLVLEIGASIKEQPKPAKAADLKAAPAPDALNEEEALSDVEPEPALGGLAVEVDRVVRAGAVISGTVVFSDGVRASWALDQTGRLSLNAGNQKDYRPSQADAQAFQQAIVKELRKHGYG
jgi:hypothetical protein